MKAPGILDQEPVIPLTGSPQVKDEDTYPSLHLSGNAEDPRGRARGSMKSENIEDTGNTEGTKDTAETEPAGESIRNGDYQVEGVQLSEKQLEKMSAYFNLKDVNPYLQQVYLIPEDFDKEADNEPVNITCVAGSYDSNRLYSIFYKKENGNALWNVVLRRRDPGQDKEDGEYRFHSNRMLDPNSEEIK